MYERKSDSKKFNSHFDKAKTPLEIINADLVGPILPSSNGGAQYSLTLVNQYLGYIDVKILQERSNTAQSIEKFKKFCENKMSIKIKKFITDGGSELVN